jgi:mono/diheme cytochrome c family protein
VSLRTADKVGLGLVAAGAVVGLCLSLDRERGGAATGFTVAPPHLAPEEGLLHERLATLFGEPSAPRAPAGFAGTGLPPPGAAGDARLITGHAVWRTQCLQCHGPAGGADTATAALLNPRPRDFGRGIVKFTGTPANSPPRREDVERSVRRGLPNTAMNGFDALPEAALQSVVDFTWWLLIRGAVWNAARVRMQSGSTADAALAAAAEAVAAAWDSARALPLEVPPAPPDSPAARARGAALFDDPLSGCATCHAADGGGRGPLVWSAGEKRWLLTDAWGIPAQPRDLRKGQYHGGNRPEDLFRRIHAGVKGTPMPGAGARLTPEQIWDLVAHLRTLAE